MSNSRSDENIEVLYLVAWVGERMLNPLDSARQFAESYLRFPAGVSHKLTLIVSGNMAPTQIAELVSLFEGSPVSIIHVNDIDFDIGKYRVALQKSNSELCCIFNSHCVIRASRWLAKFTQCACDPRVGLVGATASYESLYSEAVARLAKRKPGLGMLWRGGIPGVVRNWGFPAFPNPHIRTSSFMIRRDVFQRVRWPRNPSNMGRYLFESGRWSLTRQVMKMGLDAVIVGYDGRRFGVSEWSSSGTFRQNEQHNLLVADNRTNDYAVAAPELRRLLTIKAWGANAAK
ncbi:MAG: hypothetical protein ABSF28_22570 [Terracidiphilus sp.]|jgi:hypothetical protein